MVRNSNSVFVRSFHVDVRKPDVDMRPPYFHVRKLDFDVQKRYLTFQNPFVSPRNRYLVCGTFVLNPETFILYAQLKLELRLPYSFLRCPDPDTLLFRLTIKHVHCFKEYLFIARPHGSRPPAPFRAFTHSIKNCAKLCIIFLATDFNVKFSFILLWQYYYLYFSTLETQKGVEK